MAEIRIGDKSFQLRPKPFVACRQWQQLARNRDSKQNFNRICLAVARRSAHVTAAVANLKRLEAPTGRDLFDGEGDFVVMEGVARDYVDHFRVLF